MRAALDNPFLVLLASLIIFSASAWIGTRLHRVLQIGESDKGELLLRSRRHPDAAGADRRVHPRIGVIHVVSRELGAVAESMRVP